MHGCMHIHMYTYVHTCIHIFMRIHIHVCTCIHARTCIQHTRYMHLSFAYYAYVLHICHKYTLDIPTDIDGNRQLDFMEFVAIVDELSTGALRSAEPQYTEEPAPAEFLQKVAPNQKKTTTSSARHLTPSLCVATLFGVCTMMRVIATRR